MEFYTISVNNCAVTVIFNGRRYFFHSYYYGLVCVAERDPENENHFTIISGNSHTIGSRFAGCIRPAAKRFISKLENKYIRKKITYTEEFSRDLSDSYLFIEERQYK